MKFGEVLSSLGYINEQQLSIALKEQEYNIQTVAYSEPLGNILLRNGIINEQQHYEALIQYYKQLSNDTSEPAYVKETAKVALQALEKQGNGEKMSEEAKIALLEKIEFYKEKIGQLENINKIENEKEIYGLIKKIGAITQDIHKFS